MAHRVISLRCGELSAFGGIVQGYLKAKRLGGREVDNQIEFRGLLYWKLGGLGSAQYLIYQVGGAPPHARPVWSIGYQAARQRWQPCGRDRTAAGTSSESRLQNRIDECALDRDSCRPCRPFSTKVTFQKKRLGLNPFPTTPLFCKLTFKKVCKVCKVCKRPIT
jgi:hypothetical protein